MENQSPMDSPSFSSRRQFHLFMTLVDGVAWTGRMFLRYRIGSEQPGLAGALGVLVGLLFVGFGYPPEPKTMLCFLGAFILLSGIRKAAARRREAGPEAEHSQCVGYSYLQRILPFLPTRIVEGLFEPFVLFALGAIIRATWSPLLGSYLWLVALCMFLVSAAQHMVGQRELRVLRDQYIYQRNRAAAFRNLMNEGETWRR